MITVGELIKELKKYDTSLPVTISTKESCPNEIVTIFEGDCHCFWRPMCVEKGKERLVLYDKKVE